MTAEKKPLWIEIDDSNLPESVLHESTVIRELATEEEAKDDELLLSVYQYAIELEDQGLLPEDISKLVVERLKEVAAHLTPTRNSYPPFDVSVERGVGWGTVVYFDAVNRQDDGDDESWGDE